MSGVICLDGRKSIATTTNQRNMRPKHTAASTITNTFLIRICVSYCQRLPVFKKMMRKNRFSILMFLCMDAPVFRHVDK